MIEIAPEVGAIATTGYSKDPVMLNWKNYGFGGVMAKPYSKKNLKEALRRLLGNDNM
ncbi:MAG: hypothetical protein SWQ30_15565 [Thermodesulfobacteriota bacterium]|nr:hypothetical protein [Thermodesulfobacteriota bacterium]